MANEQLTRDAIAEFIKTPRGVRHYEGMQQDVAEARKPTGVLAGTYANPTSITVDEYGRITAIS